MEHVIKCFDRDTHHVLMFYGVGSNMGEIMLELKSNVNQCQAIEL